MSSMVKICGLKKNYGDKQAVMGIDLEIPAGELFVLVGPNGAGKTTTLKMLTGLLRPTAGAIEIGGIDIVKDPTRAKEQMSFVPDVPYVYEKLTPRELLRFVGKLYRLDPATIEKEGDKLLEFFSIAHVRDVLIEEFSHGMRQKVVLAAALLHNPKLFILDEPMVGLDPIGIRSFKDFLKKKSGKGMTIIFSTHTLSMAEELGHRIGIIDKGRLIALGSIDELRRQYHSQENLENMFLKLIEHELPK